MTGFYMAHNTGMKWVKWFPVFSGITYKPSDGLLNKSICWFPYDCCRIMESTEVVMTFLTYFTAIFSFLYPLKITGFLTFSGGIEMKY